MSQRGETNVHSLPLFNDACMTRIGKHAQQNCRRSSRMSTARYNRPKHLDVSCYLPGN